MAVAYGNGSKSGVNKSPIGLRFAIVQNKFQQTNKTKINHISDNHIKVSLHFWGIGPTMWRWPAAIAVSLE